MCIINLNYKYIMCFCTDMTNCLQSNPDEIEIEMGLERDPNKRSTQIKNRNNTERFKNHLADPVARFNRLFRCKRGGFNAEIVHVASERWCNSDEFAKNTSVSQLHTILTFEIKHIFFSCLTLVWRGPVLSQPLSNHNMSCSHLSIGYKYSTKTTEWHLKLILNT